MAVVRTVELLDEGGTVQGMVATVTDITEEAAPATRQIISESPAMVKLLEFVRRVAISEATSILIEGETLDNRVLTGRGVTQEEPKVCDSSTRLVRRAVASELVSRMNVGEIFRPFH